MFFVFFLMIGAFFIISNNNIALIQEGNFASFVSLYSSWLEGIVTNSAQTAGYAIKLEWLPNQTLE